MHAECYRNIVCSAAMSAHRQVRMVRGIDEAARSACMLSSFDRAAKSTVSPAPANCLNRRDGKSPVTDDTVWIDLNFPTSEEDAETEKALGIEIPTRAEMRQIEASNR